MILLNAIFQSVSFDGEDRRYIQPNTPNPFGLTVFKSYVYWVDRNLQKVSFKQQRGLRIYDLPTDGDCDADDSGLEDEEEDGKIQTL